jgi:hypothetical protein
MILFLDFDGVLHPDAAFLERRKPVLRAQGELFMWANLLADALIDRHHVQIVLSTSWTRELGFSRARDFLPEALRRRVVGATWHSQMGRHPDDLHRSRLNWWDDATRYAQIKRWISRAGVQDWIAVDDKPEGWAESDRDRLIQTDSETGLSDPSVQARLAFLLGPK